MNHHISQVSTVLFISFWSLSCNAQSKSETKPNIVLILADDLGYSDVAYMHQKPELKEAYFIDHLPLEEVTIAEVLKKQGYTTGFFGKWHLAGQGSIYTSDGIVNANFHPDKQGFDVNIGGCAYGQPDSYFSPYKNGTIKDGPEGEYLTDRLGDEAVKFIDANKDHPFFPDLSTYTVHMPLQAPAETVAKYNGNKGSLHEGGIRVPLIVSCLKNLNPENCTSSI